MIRNPDMPPEVIAGIQKVEQELRRTIRLAQEASYSSNTRIETELYKIWLRLARVRKTAEETTDMNLRKKRS